MRKSIHENARDILNNIKEMRGHTWKFCMKTYF